MEKLSVKISAVSLPSNYTCDGDDISPEVEIGRINTELTTSLALVMNDPDAPGGVGSHIGLSGTSNWLRDCLTGFQMNGGYLSGNRCSGEKFFRPYRVQRSVSATGPDTPL